MAGVDLELYKGELTVLLGASCSGKLTLQNILSGLNHATDGRVWFEQTELTDLPDRGFTKYRRDHLGFVFQFCSLISSLTARENVAHTTLRTLGFGRGEVSYILMEEMMLIVLIALPFSWLIGAWIARLMTNNFTSDLYAIPVVVKPATFSIASLVVLAAAFVSAMLVRRRLDRLDLVSVMKTRE